MSVDGWLLIAAAAGFAVISGANDGATLLALSLKFPTIGVPEAAVVLAAAIVVGPLLVGTGVATTLADRLVAFDQAGGRAALLVAVVSSVGVVGVLSRLGFPTSLTLALFGGIVGAGGGADLPVSWVAVAAVLAVAAAAPLAGGLLGGVLLRGLSLIPNVGSAASRLGWLHGLAFALQSFAYAANDGQKMLAVFAVATAGTSATVEPDVTLLVVIAALFSVGVLLGLRGIAETLARDVMLTRRIHAATAELSSAGAVLGSTALNAPVSMTQTITGAVLGSGVSEGYGRVRWRAAARLVVAWVVTLPAAVLLAWTVARLWVLTG